MTMPQGVYPIPLTEAYADATTRPFWEAAIEGRFVGARCTTCGAFQIPPEPRCFVCLNDRYDWVDLPGAGTVYSFTVVRRALTPEMETAIPYVSAIIELDGTQGAGARFAGNIIDCDVEAVRIGDRVTVVFDKIGEHLAVPRFRLLSDGASSSQTA